MPLRAGATRTQRSPLHVEVGEALRLALALAVHAAPAGCGPRRSTSSVMSPPGMPGHAARPPRAGLPGASRYQSSSALGRVRRQARASPRVARRARAPAPADRWAPVSVRAAGPASTARVRALVLASLGQPEQAIAAPAPAPTPDVASRVLLASAAPTPSRGTRCQAPPTPRPRFHPDGPMGWSRSARASDPRCPPWQPACVTLASLLLSLASAASRAPQPPAPRVGYAQATRLLRRKDAARRSTAPLNLLDGRDVDRLVHAGRRPARRPLTFGFKDSVTLDEVRIYTGDGNDEKTSQARPREEVHARGRRRRAPLHRRGPARPAGGAAAARRCRARASPCEVLDQLPLRGPRGAGVRHGHRLLLGGQAAQRPAGSPRSSSTTSAPRRCWAPGSPATTARRTASCPSTSTAPTATSPSPSRTRRAARFTRAATAWADAASRWSCRSKGKVDAARSSASARGRGRASSSLLEGALPAELTQLAGPFRSQP